MTKATEREQLIAEHFNRETKMWYSDKHTKLIPATDEETKSFQARIRHLKNIDSLGQEDIFVLSIINSPAPSSKEVTDKYKKLFPLVSRRKHTDKWPRVNKLVADRELFTFEEQKISHYECNCSKKELTKDIDIDLADEEAYQKLIEMLRVKHTAWLNSSVAVQKTGSEFSPVEDLTQPFCKHPFSQVEHRLKHTVGNWDCQACLNVGQEINSTQAADAAMSSGKATEWCPRFLPLLRNLAINDYIRAVQHNNTCYAGILHTEMNFKEKEYWLGPNNELFTDVEAQKYLETSQITFEEKVTKTYVVVTKKCDTCGYTFAEEKEYHEPEPVTDNEPLMFVDQEQVELALAATGQLTLPTQEEIRDRASCRMSSVYGLAASRVEAGEDVHKVVTDTLYGKNTKKEPITLSIEAENIALDTSESSKD